VIQALHDFLGGIYLAAFAGVGLSMFRIAENLAAASSLSDDNIQSRRNRTLDPLKMVDWEVKDEKVVR
jgi:hypothetical protein